MVVQPEHRRDTKIITGIALPNIRNSASITSTVDWIVNIEDSQSAIYRKYLPFDRIIIVNNGEADIWFDPNQNSDFRRLITKGTIYVFDAPEDIPALWGWRISITATTTVTANKIDIGLSRKGMVSDSFSKAISKNVFFKALLGL